MWVVRNGTSPGRAWRRSGLALLLLVVCRWSLAEAGEPAAALRSAAEYLWKLQAEDGGWHSPQYAVLRSGQALTPMVLHTLLAVPEAVCPRPKGAVGRAVAFILAHSDDQRRLGHYDADVIEYPVFSTSYALECLLSPALTEPESDVIIHAAYAKQAYRRGFGGGGPLIGQEWYQAMIAGLAAAQFSEANGFASGESAYGGWGFDWPRSPGAPGHMDLAHTRRALQALAAARRWSRFHEEFYDSTGVTRRAQVFLRVVQKHPDVQAQPSDRDGAAFRAFPPYDGGFYFSPVILDANKGRRETVDGVSYFRSYATATCDGILALIACGVPREDERLAKAIEWLRAHADFNYPEGVPREHPEPWGDAIRYYHFAARAEVYHALDWPGEWRSELAAAVIRGQADDGSFRNLVSPLMKEDDPILCTALAAAALAHCLE